MGKTGYIKCIEVYKEILRHYDCEISAKELYLIITKLVGMDDRTIKSYTKYLLSMDFLERRGNGIFRLKKDWKEII